MRRFAHRRAWRILPPYWAALTFSLLIAWFVVPQPGEAVPGLKSIVVNGLLVQDIVGASTPNGAFWSIAIEAQLYIVFPLLLLIVRRTNALTMAAISTAIVAAVGVLAPHSSLVDKLMRFTPQLAALFAMGVMAAGIVAAARRYRAWPWQWLAFAAAVPPLALVAVMGSVWTIRNFLWIDMALGPAIGCLFAAVATGRPRPFVALLDTPPLKRLGSFSYSLYLVHAPIVVAIYHLIVADRLGHGVAAFAVTVGISVPLSIAFAWGFASIFEIPFQRHRSWAALRESWLFAAVRGGSARPDAPGRAFAHVVRGGPAAHGPGGGVGSGRGTRPGQRRARPGLTAAAHRRRGGRRSRAFQQLVCQCRRSARSPRSSAGQTTTCATPGPISWSHPGQRYVLTAPSAVMCRTDHCPSAEVTRRSAPRRARSSSRLRSSSRRWFLRGTLPTYLAHPAGRAAALRRESLPSAHVSARAQRRE